MPQEKKEIHRGRNNRWKERRKDTSYMKNMSVYAMLCYYVCCVHHHPTNPPPLSLYETTTDQVPEMPLSRKENSPLSLSPLSLSLSLTNQGGKLQPYPSPCAKINMGPFGFFHSASDFLPLPPFLSLFLYPSLSFGFSPSLSPYSLLLPFIFFLERR
jgi:hypothetical protein